MSAAATGTGSWHRRVHVERVWSTVVTIDVRAMELDDFQVNDLFGACREFTGQVDRQFSPFRIDSTVSRLRDGAMSEADAPDVVCEVLAGCRYVRDLTHGAFDPWSMPGGVDPCGYVKGWAAEQLATMATASGFTNVCINAGGDVVCRGEQASGQPWRVGLQHPHQPRSTMRVVGVTRGAVATSGSYERGNHLRDPREGRSGRPDSATVVGPDGGTADALATALAVSGAYGMQVLRGLPEWSAYLVTAGRAQFAGPAFE
jgi:thiamine biosynthesis lipoprotein